MRPLGPDYQEALCPAHRNSPGLPKASACPDCILGKATLLSQLWPRSHACEQTKIYRCLMETLMPGGDLGEKQGRIAGGSKPTQVPCLQSFHWWYGGEQQGSGAWIEAKGASGFPALSSLSLSLRPDSSLHPNSPNSSFYGFTALARHDQGKHAMGNIVSNDKHEGWPEE